LTIRSAYVTVPQPKYKPTGRVISMRNKKRKRLNEKRYSKALSIAKVAAQLFSEKGYLETSVDDIADAAKMSKGALYHYFPTKDEILYFVLDNNGNLMLENLKEELEKIGDGFSKIQFIISRHINLYLNNMFESKTFINERHCLPPKYFKAIKKKEEEYYQSVAGVLSEVLGNRVTKGELTVLTFSLFGMCSWIFSWYDPNQEVSPQKLSQIIYETFCRGITKYFG
jgi:AcrR family transcriptional regulator